MKGYLRADIQDVRRMNGVPGDFVRAQLSTNDQGGQWECQRVLGLVRILRKMPLQAHRLVKCLDIDGLDQLSSDDRMCSHQIGHGRECRLRPATYRPRFEILLVDLPTGSDVLPESGNLQRFNGGGWSASDTELCHQ
ncbi:hypothetical protein D3C78_868950 [compost metagenome]